MYGRSHSYFTGYLFGIGGCIQHYPAYGYGLEASAGKNESVTDAGHRYPGRALFHI